MSFDTAKPKCEAVESRPGCIQAALCILGDKWSPLLISQLVSGAKTFGELEELLEGISPRTLSARLAKLQEDDIISRNQYQVHPPRYRYQLSEKGRGLQDILMKMAEWGEKYPDNSLSRMARIA